MVKPDSHGWRQAGDEDEWVFAVAEGVTARVVKLAEDRWGGGLVIEAPGTHDTPEDAQRAVEGLPRHIAQTSSHGTPASLAAEF